MESLTEEKKSYIKHNLSQQPYNYLVEHKETESLTLFFFSNNFKSKTLAQFLVIAYVNQIEWVYGAGAVAVTVAEYANRLNQWKKNS